MSAATITAKGQITIERSAADAGCTAVYTFDRAAANSAGMKLVV